MLHQKISDDLKEAMKAADDFKVGVLRMLLAVLHNKEIEKKGRGQEPTLSDEDVVEVLSREAKKRKEAAEIYAKGNRQDLAGKESRELEIISHYLPKQLSEAEIEKIVNEAIKKVAPSGPKDFGRAMAEAMKELKGKADAGAVSAVVKKKLGV